MGEQMKNNQAAVLRLLERHVQFKPTDTKIDTKMLVDGIRHHYMLLDMGWHRQHFIYNCVFHIDLIDGKVWIQQNRTDADIAKELIEFGVSPNDIVIGFLDEELRAYSGYAVS